MHLEVAEAIKVAAVAAVAYARAGVLENFSHNVLIWFSCILIS